MLKTTAAQLLGLLWVPSTLLSDPIELLECEVSYFQLLDTSVLRFRGPRRRMSKFFGNRERWPSAANPNTIQGL